MHEKNTVFPRLSIRPQRLECLAPIHATLSQMNNFNFDSRKGKIELGDHGKNPREKTTSSADFTSFDPNCSA